MFSNIERLNNAAPGVPESPHNSIETEPKYHLDSPDFMVPLINYWVETRSVFTEAELASHKETEEAERGNAAYASAWDDSGLVSLYAEYCKSRRDEQRTCAPEHFEIILQDLEKRYADIHPVSQDEAA